MENHSTGHRCPVVVLTLLSALFFLRPLAIAQCDSEIQEVVRIESEFMVCSRSVNYTIVNGSLEDIRFLAENPSIASTIDMKIYTQGPNGLELIGDEPDSFNIGIVVFRIPAGDRLVINVRCDNFLDSGFEFPDSGFIESRFFLRLNGGRGRATAFPCVTNFTLLNEGKHGGGHSRQDIQRGLTGTVATLWIDA